MAVTSQNSGLGLLLPWGAPHFLGAKCGLHVCGRRLRTRCPHMHSGDAKATAGGGKSSPARLPRRAHSPCQATKWRHPGPRPKEAQTVGGRGREAPSPPQPPAGPRKALEGAGAGWGLLLHQAPRAWTSSPALQGRGPRLGREAGEQTGPPCSPAPWSSPPAWRSAPCSGSRARGRRSAPRVSTSDEKFPAASGSGYVSQF